MLLLPCIKLKINRNKNCIWILQAFKQAYVYFKINRNKDCIWISSSWRSRCRYEWLIETRIVFEFIFSLLASASSTEINRNKNCIWIRSIVRHLATRKEINRNKNCIWIQYPQHLTFLLPWLIETRIVFESYFLVFFNTTRTD